MGRAVLLHADAEAAWLKNAAAVGPNQASRKVCHYASYPMYSGLVVLSASFSEFGPTEESSRLKPLSAILNGPLATVCKTSPL